MSEHDHLKVVSTMNYCKSDLKTGSPLIVMDLVSGEKKNVKEWVMDLFDVMGKPIRIQCIFKEGKKNKNGARAILEILR